MPEHKEQDLLVRGIITVSKMMDKSIQCFGSMNGNSQVTLERLHSEERKRERDLRITKEVTGQQKSMEKQRQQTKPETVPSPYPVPQNREDKLKMTS
jgi:hypothetical protein